MTERHIIISASEELVCPHCQAHFALEQGISRQTIDRYEADFDAALDARRKELEESPYFPHLNVPQQLQVVI